MPRPAPKNLTPLALLMRRRRAELGLSQVAAAERLNVSPVTWQSWESAKYQPDDSTTLRIMVALEIDPATLHTVDMARAIVSQWLATASQSSIAELLAWIDDHPAAKPSKPTAEKKSRKKSTKAVDVVV